MSTKYIQLAVDINGLDIDDINDVNFLRGWVKESVKACLLGNNKTLFNFRDMFDSDIEVTLVESAGK